MDEIWKDVKGLESIAEVSNLGNVRTKDRYVNNNGTPTLLKGKFRKGYDNGTGYIQYRFNVNGKVIRKYGHVLVLEAFSDKPEGKYEVDHIDNNKSNNKLDNLQWLTRKENVEKMFKDTNRNKKINYCINENCNNETTTKRVQCVKCTKLKSRKVERPSKEDLLKLIKNNNFSELGRTFGVDGNSVRKWCKLYDLPYLKKDIENL